MSRRPSRYARARALPEERVRAAGAMPYHAPLFCEGTPQAIQINSRRVS
jgi:hypothetical protein